MAHSFDMLTFDFLLKPPQPFTGLFFFVCSDYHRVAYPSGKTTDRFLLL